MIDVIKAILRKLGIKLEDVRISRLYDLVNVLMVPSEDWTVVFEYKEFNIVINLNEVSTKDSWMLLSKYSLYDGEMLDLERIEAIDTTAQELYKIIEEFINKEV